MAQGARDGGDRGGERGVVDVRGEATIEDRIALVAGEAGAQHWVAAEFQESARNERLRERQDLDRDLRRADRGHALRAVGDDDHPVARRGDDLLAQHRTAGALDGVERGVDFVGAIDREVDPGGHLDELDAGLAGAGFGGEAGGDGLDLKAGANLIGERRDRERGGRAGAEPDDHPGADFGNRGERGEAFVGLVHGGTP